MPKVPRVVLLVETAKSYGRGILRGIHQYIRAHQPWSTWIDERGFHDPAPPWLPEWKGDGIITRTLDRRVLELISKTSVPVVYLRQTAPTLPLPWVYSDDMAIGRLAAEHLLDRGLRHFGYLGLDRRKWTRLRHEAFIQTLQQAGHACSLFRRSRRRATVTWKAESQDLIHWLVGLPKPAGVMASHDAVGPHLLEACRWAGVAVPEEVAVVGVDNDELLCDLATPPMTSVAPDLKKMGYEAAALLDRLMAGEPAPKKPICIQPLGVVTRQSSDVTAIEDRNVAAACHRIRLHACEGITVEDVVRQASLSRRALERRFGKVLGRSPQEEIRRVQLDRVEQLLIETDHKLTRIADLAGFAHHEYMSRLFKQRTGLSPGQYREAMRRQGPAPKRKKND